MVLTHYRLLHLVVFVGTYSGPKSLCDFTDQVGHGLIAFWSRILVTDEEEKLFRDTKAAMERKGRVQAWES